MSKTIKNKEWKLEHISSPDMTNDEIVDYIIDRSESLSLMYYSSSRFVIDLPSRKKIKDFLSKAKIEVTRIEEILNEVVVRTPKISDSDIQKIRALYYPATFNTMPASTIDRTDNKEMLKKVREHLKNLPGIEITYLRKVYLCYLSDGNSSLTPDRINARSKLAYDNTIPIDKNPLLLVTNKSEKPGYCVVNYPCIYLGEAWQVGFTVGGVDYLKGCKVFFTTPETFEREYKKHRKSLVKGFKPWSDLIFICSDWCERNGTKNYSKGIDLQTPHQKRMSLSDWIIGPFCQHAQTNCKVHPFASKKGKSVRLSFKKEPKKFDVAALTKKYEEIVTAKNVQKENQRRREWDDHFLISKVIGDLTHYVTYWDIAKYTIPEYCNMTWSAEALVSTGLLDTSEQPGMTVPALKDGVTLIEFREILIKNCIARPNAAAKCAKHISEVIGTDILEAYYVFISLLDKVYAEKEVQV